MLKGSVIFTALGLSSRNDFEASSELHIKCSGTEQLRGASEISFVFRAGLEVHLGSARLRAAT